MNREIVPDLDENIAYIEKRFEGCADAVMRRLWMGDEKLEIYVIYMDSMYDRDFVDGVLLKSLLFDVSWLPERHAGQAIFNKYLATADVKEISHLDDLMDEVLKGNTGILAAGMSKAIVVSSKALPGRGVTEAETEVSVRGSKESFTESFRTNTVLIRRRIRDTRLKSKQMTIGVRSKTDVALMYMEDLVRPSVLREVLSRLESFEIDAVLDSSYLEALTEDEWYSPFPQYQSTERPDKAASALLEGRVVLVVDNTPFVILLPVTLNLFFQAAEDYYDRWEIMSLIRFMRYVAAFVAVALPGLYLALTVYHPELLPTSLALKIATTRQSIPFSVAVEVISMELAFELLREAGVRLPSPVSATIGIVGGIIIGSAAVDAGLVSPAVVIISALTGICSFVIPNISVVSGLRLSKYLVIFLSAALGLYGFWAGILLLVVHLAGLSSYGIPYLYPFCSASVNHYRDLEDSLFRLPLPWLKRQSIFMKKGGKR